MTERFLKRTHSIDSQVSLDLFEKPNKSVNPVYLINKNQLSILYL